MGSPKEKMEIIGTQMSSVYSISYHSSSSQAEMEVDEDFNNNAKKAPKRLRRLPVLEKKNKNADISTSSVSIDVEENEEQQQKIHTESYKSLLKTIHPQYPQRLYARICSNIDIEKMIFDLLLETETNPQKLVLVLTQLFVDISCYQFVDLETFVKNYDLKDLVPHLEEKDNSILEKTGKYLLNLTTVPFMSRRKHIEAFLESFILYCSKHHILYDVLTFKDIFLVLEAMGNSKRISIKHTGVFIALKFSSGLVHMAAKYVKKLEQAVETLNHDPSEETKKQIGEKVQKYKFVHEKVNDMLNMLRNNVFLNNWNSTDPRLHYMRIDYINEIFYWIKIFPARYLRNNTLDYILSCVTDPHYTVRLKAIQHVQNLVQQFSDKMLQERMVKIMSLLGLRMQDKNYQVAIAAVDAITVISRYRKIPPHIRLDICRHLYYPYFPLAKACGRFLIQKIMVGNQDESNPEEFIKSLIYFEASANEKSVKNLHPYIIEAIIDDFPYIQNIAAFMSILDEPMTEKEKPVYLNLLTESIRQTFTGKSSMPRTRSRQGKIDTILNQKMSQEFITGLIKLSTVFPLEQLSEVMILVYDVRKSG